MLSVVYASYVCGRGWVFQLVVECFFFSCMLRCCFIIVFRVICFLFNRCPASLVSKSEVGYRLSLVR